MNTNIEPSVCKNCVGYGDFSICCDCEFNPELIKGAEMNTEQYVSEHERWMTERAKRIYKAAPSEFALVTRTQTRLVHVVTGECLYQSFGEMDTSALDMPEYLEVGYDNPNATSAMDNQYQFERLDDNFKCSVDWDGIGWYAPEISFKWNGDNCITVADLISSNEEFEPEYNGNATYESALGWSQQMGLGAPVFLEIKRDYLLKSEIVSLQS